MPRGRPLLQGPADARAGVLELCRRAAALRRRLQRRLRGHARLRLRSRPVTGTPPCFRYSAARSRPIASSPSMRSTSCKPVLGIEGEAWTERAPLPGGDLPRADFEAFLGALKSTYPWLPADLAGRYARAYGTRIERLLDGAACLEGPGRASRRRPLRGGGRLPRAPRVGDDRGGHPLAALQARAARRRRDQAATACLAARRRSGGPGRSRAHDGATRQRKQTGRRRASADAARHVDTASASKRHRAKSTSVGEYADGRFIDAKETDGGSGCWWP